jgi:hypothetical protein
VTALNRLPSLPRLPRPRWLTDDVVRGVRWGAVITWAVVFGLDIYRDGIPYWRTDLLLWLVIGLAALSIGKRNLLLTVVDFAPFAAVLIVYDQLRGWSDSAGMPTWWHPQVDIDKFLFFGVEPTVWLQEHLKYPRVQWWDVLVALCYISFFFLPYVTAAVLWLRSRADFYRWGLRFVALSFVAFGFFALIPSAPPWAAAVCTDADVADHPYNPPCMNFGARRVPGNLLGTYSGGHPGTAPYVEHIATRGLEPLHLHFAAQLIDEGRNIADAVAAVPSLHVGGIVLFSLFMWPRLQKAWRPLLVLYPLFMTFTLTYGGEHYVTDALAGGLCALAVHLVANWIERWRDRRRTPDTLDVPPQDDLETPCPPTQPQRETTPSST